VITQPVVSPPYQGIMTFGLSESALSSKWFVNSIDSCKSNICASDAIELDTSSYTDGSHRLDAVVEMAADVFVYVNQTIVIYNPKLTLSLKLQDSNIDTTLILPSATSKAQITEVSYFVDEVLVTTQTDKTPITVNQCDRWGCSDVSYAYHLKWSKEYGEHTIKVTVSDSDGQYQEKAQSITVNNAPIISIDAPLSEQLITNDVLQVTGTVDNENENVTTTVSFGDIQLGQKLGRGDFSYSYSLAGLPEGNYQIAVQAVDEFNINKKTQVQFKYAPSLTNAVLIRTLPDGFTLIDINDTQLLAQNQNRYLIDDLTKMVNNQRTVDIPTNINIGTSYVSQNGNFSFISSSQNTYNIFNMYLHDGNTLTNLKKLVPFGGGQVTKGAFNQIYVIGLENSGGNFYIWDIDTLTYEVLKAPTSRWLNWHFTNNDEWMCQSAPINLGYDVYIYQFDSGKLPTRLTNNGGSNTGSSGYGSFCTGNDSEYVAYTTSPQNSETVSLHLYHLNDQTIQLLSSSVTGTGTSTKSEYADGILVWQEFVSNQKVLKIYDTATLLTAEIKEATFREVRFGKVSYTTDAGLFVWDKYNRTSHNIWPNSVSHYLSQSTNYIQSGQLIYRIDNLF
jgi:hypothetical protein